MAPPSKDRLTLHFLPSGRHQDPAGCVVTRSSPVVEPLQSGPQFNSIRSLSHRLLPPASPLRWKSCARFCLVILLCRSVTLFLLQISQSHKPIDNGEVAPLSGSAPTFILPLFSTHFHGLEFLVNNGSSCGLRCHTHSCVLRLR